jgi:hypothetical protein
MKAITIRNLPKKVERLIRTKAQERSMSINKVVISLLEERAGKNEKKKRKRVYHDLDHLSGKWSGDEYREFKNTLYQQRGIDEELWK